MKIGVIVFPDFDCGRAQLFALNNILGINAQAIWHEEKEIKKFDAIFLSCGTTWLEAMKESQETSPIIEEIFEFAERGGFIFASGEGFNLLCKLKLLPGWFETNKTNRFISRNIYIRADNIDSALTTLVEKNKQLKIPLSCINGKYRASEHDLIRMRQSNQIIFRFCDDDAKITDKINYTGSIDNIAAISNNLGNIYGMTPRPEFATDESIGNTDGRFIFESILAWIM